MGIEVSEEMVIVGLWKFWFGVQLCRKGCYCGYYKFWK